MSIAYSNADKAVFAQVLRLLVAQGVDLPGDLETLSDTVDAITSSLGGPDAFAENAPHSSLNFNYKAGRISLNGGAPIEVAAGTLALTDNATNYVEVSSAGTVSKNTSAFTAGKSPLFVVTTLSGVIVNGGVVDMRSFLSLLSAGAVGTTSLADAAVTGVKLASASEILTFGRQNIGASESGNLATPAGCYSYVMDTGGYLIGDSAGLSAALVGGSVLFKPTINGTAVSQTGLNLLNDVSNPQYKYASIAWAAHSAYAFSAGDRLGLNFAATSLNPDATLAVAALLRIRRT